MRSVRPAIEELERAFAVFAPLFQVAFPKPVIAIQTKGKKNALGWFVGDKWENGEADAIAEITIAAEHLKGAPEDIAETLLHEMAHYANNVEGVRDCSSFQYHNRHFKERAESVGLVVEKGPRGWAYTKLGPDLLEKVQKAHLDPEAFSLFRTAAQQKKQPGKMKKWSCGCTNVRAATEVEAVCHRCGQPFLLEL
jgi:hypothetical protein